MPRGKYYGGIYQEKYVSKTYYIVLGISKGADLKKIKRAYRTVAKKYHPDITRTKESAERFIEIREAYETLSDEAKRKGYDKEIEKQGSALRISKVSEIIASRRSLFDEMDAFSKRGYRRMSFPSYSSCC